MSENLNRLMKSFHRRTMTDISEYMRHADAAAWFERRSAYALEQMVAFTPWIVRSAMIKGDLSESSTTGVIAEGSGAVVFLDVSGFTALTEALCERADGTEVLSRTLNGFFKGVIATVEAYCGDVIKFSGDALTIVFNTDDLTGDTNPASYAACGSDWCDCPGHPPLELATLRAAACCVELHRKFNGFETGVTTAQGSTLQLSLHIGVGVGNFKILYVGGCAPPGGLPRFEYVLTGDPLAQIAIAEPLAGPGQTVLSPQAWEVAGNLFTESIQPKEQAPLENSSPRSMRRSRRERASPSQSVTQSVRPDMFSRASSGGAEEGPSLLTAVDSGLLTNFSVSTENGGDEVNEKPRRKRVSLSQFAAVYPTDPWAPVSPTVSQQSSFDGGIAEFVRPIRKPRRSKDQMESVSPPSNLASNFLTIEPTEGFRFLLGLDTSKHTYPTVKSAACRISGMRAKNLEISSFFRPILKRFLPLSVVRGIESGTSRFGNELRVLSVAFVSVVTGGTKSANLETSEVYKFQGSGIFSSGLAVNGSDDSIDGDLAQRLMVAVQNACYEEEGQVNKFLVDDKGVLFLCLFGTPPLVHRDDPKRAISACIAMRSEFDRLGVSGRFGVTTGTAFCGVVGGQGRWEYTCLGDAVNLAARLMQKASIGAIYTDDRTRFDCQESFQFAHLPPMKVKGKSSSLSVFQVLSDSQEISMSRLQSVSSSRRIIDQTSSESECTQFSSTAPPNANKVLYALGESGHWPCFSRVSEIIDLILYPPGMTVTLAGSVGTGRGEITEWVISKFKRKWRENGFAVVVVKHGGVGDRIKPVQEFIETAAKLGVTEDLDDYGTDRSLAESALNLLRKWVANSRFTTLLKNAHISSSDRIEFNPVFESEEPWLYGTATSEEEISMSDSDWVSLAAFVAMKLRESVHLLIILEVTQGTSVIERTLSPCFWALAHALEALRIETIESTLSLFIIGGQSAGVEQVRRLRSEDPGEATRGRMGGTRRGAGGALPERVGRSIYVAMEPLTLEATRVYVKIFTEIFGRAGGAGGDLEIPSGLTEWVYSLAGGHPLHTREILEQLMSRGVLLVEGGLVRLTVPDMEIVNVAEWGLTDVVGSVVERLEGLEPQEFAVVKIAAVFVGSFSVADIAASMIPRFRPERTLMDEFRIFTTCARLVDLAILVKAPIDADNRSIDLSEQTLPGMPNNDEFEMTHKTKAEAVKFRLTDPLIRKVACSMLLFQQRVTIKRQALISRALLRDLPILRAAQKRKDEAHKSIRYFHLVDCL